MKKIQVALEDILTTVLSRTMKGRVQKLNHGLAQGLLVEARYVHMRNPFSKRRVSLEDRFLFSLDFSGMTVYDIGAHIGTFTMFFARRVGNLGRVLSFEPNSSSYRTLKKHVKINGFSNVETLDIGIGAHRETRQLLYVPQSSGTGSMKRSIQMSLSKSCTRVKSTVVQVDTLDNCIETHNLSEPDFVKIDVEGMEYDVLLGMSKTLDVRKPFLFIELHGVSETSKIANSKKLIDYLKPFGYALYHVESNAMIDAHDQSVPGIGHIFAYTKTRPIRTVPGWNLSRNQKE